MMSWLTFWLTALSITVSRGCLKCSPDAIRVLNEVKGPYLDSKLRGDSELREKLRKALETNFQGLSQQPMEKGQYMGVIDQNTLQQLTTHFKRSMSRIMENQFDGAQLFNEIMWSLQDLLVAFKKLQKDFQKVYCSNECGRMDYLFTNCFSCNTHVYSCRKNFFCGERKVKVEVDEDLILDCAMWWHRYNYGIMKYAFYRIVNGEQQEMATTMDSFLVKKAANANDTGKYRCMLFGAEEYPKSTLDFQVTVGPPVGKTTWFPRPSPTLEGPLTMAISSRASPPQGDWMVWIVIGVTGGLLIIIVAAFLCYYRLQNEKEEKEESDEEEEEDESESSEQEEK